MCVCFQLIASKSAYLWMCGLRQQLLIKEIQISRHMTIYGQTLGVFKRKNNECIRNREKTKLNKIKIVVLDFTHVVLLRVFRHELRHYDVIMT